MHCLLVRAGPHLRSSHGHGECAVIEVDWVICPLSVALDVGFTQWEYVRWYFGNLMAFLVSLRAASIIGDGGTMPIV